MPIKRARTGWLVGRCRISVFGGSRCVQVEGVCDVLGVFITAVSLRDQL